MRSLVYVLLIVVAPMGAYAIELSVSTDSVIHDLSTGDKKSYKAKEKISYVNRQPLWIESSGKIPVILIPLKSETGIVNIDSPNAAEVFKAEKELRIDQELSTVTMELTNVHRLIAEQKFSAAKEKVAELKARYPNVKFLEFIDASISFLTGDRERAITSVEEGLRHHPEYQQGIELKEKLGGGKSE